MTRHAAPTRLVTLLVLLVAHLAAGCQSITGPSKREQEQAVSEEQLRARLNEFSDLFASALERASHEISRSGGLEARRQTIAWRARAVPGARSAVGLPNPLEAFIDVWALCVQQRIHFESGAGADLFGEDQHIAVSTCLELERSVEAIGAVFLDDEEIDRARSDVLEFAIAHPIQGSFSRQGNLPSGAKDSQGLGWIVKQPLKVVTPFRGINAGAKAIRQFTVVAGEFQRTIDQWPEELAWRMELLMCDIEERGTIRSGKERLGEISESMISLASTAESLPDEARRTVTHTFDELEDGQEGVRATLEDASSLLEETRASLDRAEVVVLALDRTLASATAAGEAWRSVGEAFATDDEDQSVPEDPDAPSWAEELDGTAKNVTEAAHELRQLIAEARELTGGPETEALLESTEAASRSAIDHAAWRGGQLVLLVLGAGLVYSYLSRRMR